MGYDLKKYPRDDPRAQVPLKRNIPPPDRRVTMTDPIYSLLRAVCNLRQGLDTPVTRTEIRNGIARLGSVQEYHKKVDFLVVTDGKEWEVYRLTLDDLMTLNLDDLVEVTE